MELFNSKGGRLYLTPKEREQFIQEATKLKKPKDLLFCKFLYYTGVRISEALNVNNEMVDIESKSVIIKTLKQDKKTYKYRNIPLPEHFINELVLVFNLRGNHRKKFNLFDMTRMKGWYVVKGIMQRCGIKGPQATPKGLRHGFAVACVLKNINILTIQKWLGHAHLKHTGIYANVMGEEEREVAQKLWD